MNKDKLKYWKALAERDEFLAENPHLMEMQSRIDEILDKSDNRIKALEALMTQYVTLLRVETQLLQRMLEDLSAKK